MRRLVLDANTLASGSVEPDGESPPCVLYRELAGEALFEAIACPELLAELAETLRKPYFLERIGEGGVEDIVGAVTEATTVFADPSPIEPVLRDPDDDYLLGLAREAGAEAIVTGDRDLLDEAESIEPTAITAREACERLGCSEARGVETDGAAGGVGG